MKLTAINLRYLLRYEPETGLWYWRESRGTKKAGSRAGCNDEGYWRIRIEKVNYRASRLAVLYMKGRWPVAQVDHKNLKKLDDRWENLREATSTQNQGNIALNQRNTSGYKGVRWSPRHKKFQARIVENKKLRNLGFYKTAKQAQTAYLVAARKYFGEFARV
jgi:hypothetical protein